MCIFTAFENNLSQKWKVSFNAKKRKKEESKVFKEKISRIKKILEIIDHGKT
jgi:hypothetical protein